MLFAAYRAALVAMPDWDWMPEGSRRLPITQAVSDFRKVPKKRLLEEYPELAAAEERGGRGRG